MPSIPCRFCAAPLRRSFVDLGMHPLCESFVSAEQVNAMEPFYPLHVHVCERCFLVQLQDYVGPEAIFTEYAYFSSYSDSWVAHARRYTEAMIDRFGLNDTSWVVELASNDGYLLQHFVAAGVPCLGIEPAANVAAVASGKGIPTEVAFFGAATARDLAARGRKADLLLGNNVLAQVPDLNDFVAGLALLLAPRGVITMEFPHLMRLIEGNQFDTIYHEHFSYFSFLTTERIFAAHGLVLFDVEELPTHGGSHRIFARHADDATRPIGGRVLEMRERETRARLHEIEGYASFAAQVEETKRALLDFLIGARRAGKTVVGYGAPGKGNTLLNYCGIRTDFIEFLVDRNPYKHGRVTPGTHIPIHPPDRLREAKPDYVLILPWNLTDEIVKQMSGVRDWGGRFVVPIPRVQVL
jgi:hypothetical protein